MNWLTNFVKPRLQSLVAKRDVPENLWVKCPGCEAMVYRQEYEAAFRICPKCDHHGRLPSDERLKLLFDAGYAQIELPRVIADPLKFRDTKKYVDRLRDSQAKTRLQDAIRVGHGTIGGHPAVVAAFDFGFMGGSMGMAVGEALLTAARLAVLQQAALIVVPASGGARMQEGILSLMQMPRTVIASKLVKEAGLPYLVLLTDPTTGGVSASFAMLGDIQLAEPGATIGFAGARVIEETIREKLPEGFQTAGYLLDHGMIDMVVHRMELKPSFARLIGLLTRPMADAEGAPRAAAPRQPDAARQAGIALRAVEQKS